MSFQGEDEEYTSANTNTDQLAKVTDELDSLIPADYDDSKVKPVFDDDEEEEDEDDDDDIAVILSSDKPIVQATPSKAANPASNIDKSVKNVSSLESTEANATAAAVAAAAAANVKAIASSGLPLPDESAYDFDLESTADKPWRRAGIDRTDYFNYGFDENTWNAYRQKQVSLRAQSGQSSRPPAPPTANSYQQHQQHQPQQPYQQHQPQYDNQPQNNRYPAQGYNNEDDNGDKKRQRR